MTDQGLRFRLRGARSTRLLTGCAVTAAAALGGPTGAAARQTIVNPDQSGPVPWQVYMEAKSGGTLTICGGTVRDALHVITAAHCVIDASTGQFVESAAVEAGTVHLASPEPTAQVRNATAAAVDPDFKFLANGALTGDAAVLTLEAPLDLSNPAVVDSLPPIEAGGTGTVGVVSGWGRTDPANDQSSPDALQIAAVDVYGPSACANYGADFTPSTMLCAGRVNQNGTVVDSCQGDSGGPLARATGTDAAGNVIVDGLLGITSWGNGCANPSFPGLYTNVGNASINAFLKQSNPASRPLRRIRAARVAAAFRQLAE
jgi:secreted trypsin-like serine protease